MQTPGRTKLLRLERGSKLHPPGSTFRRGPFRLPSLPHISSEGVWPECLPARDAASGTGCGGTDLYGVVRRWAISHTKWAGHLATKCPVRGTSKILALWDPPTGENVAPPDSAPCCGNRLSSIPSRI